MKTIPIVFAFDNRLIRPAAVAIFSLLTNAHQDTFYDIFILHSKKEKLDKMEIAKVTCKFTNCRVSYRMVGDIFDNAFEIRQITTPAYYRLLIPELIPEYDKVLYSDVDVIFRNDLTSIYNIDIDGFYFGGVNSMSHFNKDLVRYYTNKLNIDPSEVIYSGNLLVNCKELRASKYIMADILERAKGKYVFQDMDVINIVCNGYIKFLPPAFCLTNYINKAFIDSDNRILDLWSEKELRLAMEYGVIHYNGQKPWKGYCANFDIWWEYYRKSPVFDPKYYFYFFHEKLNELDHLTFWKRVKILVRWFFVR